MHDHVVKKLMKRLSNVKSPKKAKGPPSKKPQQTSLDVTNTDDDSSASASTIILERPPVSPMGIPVNLPTKTSTPSPKTSTSEQKQDSSGEERMYCITFGLLVLLVSLEISCPR